MTLKKSVQTFGKKKNSTAVAQCSEGNGTIRVNGKPLALVEPVLLLGKQAFANVDIRVRVTGGGYVSQIYAIRIALSRALVAYHQKYEDESSKRQIKETLL